MFPTLCWISENTLQSAVWLQCSFPHFFLKDVESPLSVVATHAQWQWRVHLSTSDRKKSVTTSVSVMQRKIIPLFFQWKRKLLKMKKRKWVICISMTSDKSHCGQTNLIFHQVKRCAGKNYWRCQQTKVKPDMFLVEKFVQIWGFDTGFVFRGRIFLFWTDLCSHKLAVSLLACSPLFNIPHAPVMRDCVSESHLLAWFLSAIDCAAVLFLPPHGKQVQHFFNSITKCSEVALKKHHVDCFSSHGKKKSCDLKATAALFKESWWKDGRSQPRFRFRRRRTEGKRRTLTMWLQRCKTNLVTPDQGWQAAW